MQVLGAESHSLPLRITFVCFDERAWLWILVCSSETSITWMLDFLNYFSIVWLFVNLLAFSLAAVAFSLSFIIVREFPEEWRTGGFSPLSVWKVVSTFLFSHRGSLSGPM